MMSTSNVIELIDACLGNFDLGAFHSLENVFNLTIPVQ